MFRRGLEHFSLPSIRTRPTLSQFLNIKILNNIKHYNWEWARSGSDWVVSLVRITKLECSMYIVVVSLRFIKTADLQVFPARKRLSSMSVSKLLKLVRLAQDEPGHQDDEDDDDGDESSLSDGADLRQVVLFYSPSPPRILIVSSA